MPGTQGWASLAAPCRQAGILFVQIGRNGELVHNFFCRALKGHALLVVQGVT